MENEKAYLVSEIEKKKAEHIEMMCHAYFKKSKIDPKKIRLIERNIDGGREWFFREIADWDDPANRMLKKCSVGHECLISTMNCPICMQTNFDKLNEQYIAALEFLKVTQFGFAEIRKTVCMFCENTKAEGHKESCSLGKYLESLK